MKAQEFIREAELPAKAINALFQIRNSLKQPGDQIQAVAPAVAANLAQPDPAQELTRGDLPQLQQRAQQLQKLIDLAAMVERMKTQIERSPMGMNRGLEADFDLLAQWPVPNTDKEMLELAQYYQRILSQLQRKKTAWR